MSNIHNYSANIEAAFVDTLNSVLSPSIPSKIALAVSGGVDSMALFHLVTHWQQSVNVNQKVEIHILHINHGIRQESIKEEEFVENISLSKRYKFFCYHWNGSKVNSSLQEQARAMRYDQMSEYCLDNNIPVIITAHHKNDLVENYIFRKRRGARELGLSSSFQTYHNDIRVIRPLISFCKDELIKYMQDNNNSWIEDISNTDSKYSRNSIRKELANFDKNIVQEIEQEIKNNDRSCLQIEQDLIAAIAESVEISNHGYAKINLQKYQLFAENIKITLLSHVLTIISGAKQIPRYRNLSKLIALLNSGESVNNTLHSCYAVKYRDTLFVFKEYFKIYADKLPLKQGVIWDGRFQFLAESHLSDNLNDMGYTVSKLHQKDIAYLKNNEDYLQKLGTIDDFEQKILLLTFPVIKKLEKIVALPHIFYYDDDNLKDTLKVIFRPSFVSRFTHFQNYSKG